MAFTLVYTADHFVFDILLGWTYATIVFVARPSGVAKRVVGG